MQVAARDGQIDGVAAAVASEDLVPTVAEGRSDQASGTAKEKKGKLKDLFDK